MKSNWEPRSRRVVREFGEETLRTALPWLAGIGALAHAVGVPIDIFLGPPEVALPAQLSAPIPLLLVGLAIWFARRPPERAHAAAFVVIFTFLIAPTLHLWLAPKPINLLVLAAISVGVFYFFVDHRWLAAAQGLVLAATAFSISNLWITDDVRTFAAPAASIWFGGFALHVGRHRMLLRLVESIALSRERSERLERALEDLSREAGERQRVQREAAATQKLESLGLMAGGLAHDFNNLLVAILGGAELALENLGDPKRLRDSLEMVRNASLEARDLSAQMLDYAGGRPVRHQPVDLRRLARAAARYAESFLPPDVCVKLDFEPRLPNVDGDRARLQQAFVDLLKNAGEAMEGRSGEIRVSMRLDRDDGAIVVAVEDSGGGIPPEVQDRVFDPFFSTKFVGRGLGLSSVLGTVRSHGGHVEIESEPGAGTRVTFTLPASSGERQDDSIPAPRKSHARRVLVVDDEAAVREVAAQLLERLGYEVDAVASGSEAIERLRATPLAYQAALVDATMPEMDGGETVVQLRAIRSDLPIAISSGYRGRPRRFEPFPGPPLRFLDKPFGRAHLAACLRELDSGDPLSSRA